MDANKHDESLVSLDILNGLIKSQYGDSISSILVNSSQSPFLSVWLKETNRNNESFSMNYLPLFYVIASHDKDSKLSLKLITFHGKVLEELNGFTNLISDQDKLNFFGKLEKMKLCQGIQMPDNDLKLDASTFAAMYLVERLDQHIIVRSQQCQYGLYGESICKMCASLNTAYSSNKLKDDPGDEDPLYYTDGVEYSAEAQYEQEPNASYPYLSSPLEIDNMSGQNELDMQLIRDESEYEISITNTKCRKKRNIKNTSKASQKDKTDTKKTKKENSTVIKCKHCPYETNAIKLLMIHNIETHSPGFNGDFCDETGTYRCEECSFSTAVKKEYIDHISSAHGSSVHQCKICGKILGRKDSLRTHMNTVHKRPYKCPSCPYETAQESRLTRHIQAVHDKVKRYFCEQCSYATSDNYSLKFHIKSVHEKLKPYICEQCTYATSTRQALNNHIKAVHEKLKPFLCELCSTSFSTKYLLVQHVSVIHNKVKEFKCKQCPYETARKYYLLDHIRSVHEKIKQFRCDLCSFETAVKCNLKNHILAVHDKTKPFQCQMCSFEAIRKKQLSQHIAAVHDETSQL